MPTAPRRITLILFLLFTALLCLLAWLWGG